MVWEVLEAVILMAVLAEAALKAAAQERAEVPKAAARNPAEVPREAARNPEIMRSQTVQIKKQGAVQRKARMKQRNPSRKPKSPKKRMKMGPMAGALAVMDQLDRMLWKVRKPKWKPYLPRFFRSQRMKRRPENQKTFMMT